MVVIGTYVVLILVVLILLHGGSSALYAYAPWLLAGLLILFLVRYVSTLYSLDDTHLRAWRVLGGRSVRLSDVRKIEYSSMRVLGPTGGIFGSWGWRGRMWSPELGKFDAIYTDAARGLLVTAGDVPMYITPLDLEGFARELSRRARSYSGRLLVDVGDPRGGSEEEESGAPPSRVPARGSQLRH